MGDPLGGGGGRQDDPFDNLSSWPALANFVDDIGGGDQPGGADQHMLPDLLNHSNLSLQRSLSLPAYLSGESSQAMGGMAPLSRQYANRANSFGPLAGNNMNQGMDANAEISARLVSMLSKVRRRAPRSPLIFAGRNWSIRPPASRTGALARLFASRARAFPPVYVRRANEPHHCPLVA